MKKNVKIFTDVIDGKAVNQVYELAELDAFEDSKIRIMPDCLTEDTEVLTDHGYKKIIELRGNEKIANYDINTGKIIFAIPKNIIIRDLRPNEKIYRFSNANVDFSVSENHRMPIRNKGTFLAKDVDELVNSSLFFNGNGLKDTDSIKKYNDDDVKLIAWIVGDGSFKITHNPKSDNYRIRFGLKKKRKIHRILSLLDNMKLSYHYSVDKRNQTIIYLNTQSSKKYVELLKKIKEFPDDFIYLSKEQAKIFINEIIQVDGDYENYIKKNKKSWTYFSSNKHDIDIISAILSINFGKATIRKRINNNGFKKGTITYRVIYTPESTILKSKSGFNNKPIKKEIVDYNGKLVCISCDTTFFIARQNGTSFITGNCHVGRGCVVGFTGTYTDKIIPNIVGSDIDCGMLLIELGKVDIDLPVLDKFIKENIPMGRNYNEKPYKNREMMELRRHFEAMHCYPQIRNKEGLMCSVGSLGGGR